MEAARIAAEPRNILLAQNFYGMTGDEFEQFLAAVFRYLGYHVEEVGGTGDQGADLIITKHDRVVIQAKCYGRNNYCGNDAVQQAIAATFFHRANRCVVITTSFYSNAARALAQSANCMLIEGEQIRDLIWGRIEI